tara:strand:+ start:412 stop:612 length:201 start_codon:yes stop_codon:yes gene_type:complete
LTGVKMEKVKALIKSRRFWTAVGGVFVVAAQETLGLDPETTNRIVALAVAWILGDSLRVTSTTPTE